MSLDPYADWIGHDPTSCRACNEHGPLRRELTEDRRLLPELIPEPGHWPNPASLSRFDQVEMDIMQFKRFMKKVKPQQLDWHTPCWLWDGGTHEKGYGRFYLGLVQNRRIHAYTHRVAFEHWIGFPPAGYIVDHQCNHKLCCNPTHLWPETNDNNLRLADQRRPWKRRNQYSQE